MEVLSPSIRTNFQFHDDILGARANTGFPCEVGSVPRVFINGVCDFLLKVTHTALLQLYTLKKL